MIYDEKLYKEMMERCNYIPTDGMSSADWLELRETYIGGSDVGPIMELSDYGSKLTVYLQKKGLVDSPVESPAAHRGKILEPVIRQITHETFPELEIAVVPYIFFSKEETFRGANIDGVILAPDGGITIEGIKLEGLGGHEIKSSKTGYGFGKDEVPDAYFAQVQHYMDVLGLSWFLLSVFIIESDGVRHYPVLKNPEFIKDMREQECDFWNNYFLTDTMPAAIGIDNEEEMITGIFNGSRSTIVLGDKEIALCAERVELNNTKKAVEKRIEAIDVNLKALLTQKAAANPEEKKAYAIAGRYSISWSRFDTRRIDTDALKKAGLYDQYSKISESGRFTITEKQGA
jgi:putative phage-type endonuclease